MNMYIVPKWANGRVHVFELAKGARNVQASASYTTRDASPTTTKRVLVPWRFDHNTTRTRALSSIQTLITQ